MKAKCRMKTSTLFPLVVAIGMLTMLGLTASRAAEFVWTGGATGDNAALWGADITANWQDGVIPINNPGDTVNILGNWPSTAFGTRLIQLRNTTTTIGVLNFNSGDDGTVTINRQAGQGLTFDNNGSNAQLNGLGGTSDFSFAYVPITLADTLEVDMVSTVPQVFLGGTLQGPGGLIVKSGKVYVGSSQLYIGETRIESGAELNIQHSQTWNATTSIVVNGTWSRVVAGTAFLSLAPGQVLSGTGTVNMGHQYWDFRSGGAKIAPGDDGIGTLTFETTRLELDGGTFEFEIGEAAADKIISTRLLIGATPGTIEILDAGRTTPGTFTLFDYGALDGTVSNWENLGLQLPDKWLGYLTHNVANTSIDFVLTEIIPEPTTAWLLLLGSLALFRRHGGGRR